MVTPSTLTPNFAYSSAASITQNQSNGGTFHFKGAPLQLNQPLMHAKRQQQFDLHKGYQDKARQQEQSQRATTTSSTNLKGRNGSTPLQFTKRAGSRSSSQGDSGSDGGDHVPSFFVSVDANSSRTSASVTGTTQTEEGYCVPHSNMTPGQVSQRCKRPH